MAIVNMRDMLYHAYKNSYAVGAFDLVSLDFLEAVINAAERCRAPVILSLAEPHFKHYDFELMMAAVETAAKRATVPVAIQLDHGTSLDSAVRAINLGCNGIMVDSSQQQLPENIQATKAVVEMAHGCGVPVVGELGYVAGMEGEEAERHPGEAVYTVPAEAKTFVERSGVDFLAVSIGTIQGRVKGRTKLDFPRLKQIHSAVDIPLVIHGGSGLTEEQFRRLTAMGVAKINYFTALSDVAAEAMRAQMKSGLNGSFIDLKRGVKEAIGAEVERCLKLWSSAGRAAEVLAQCQPWEPVEHLVIYNIEGAMARNSNEMMSEGRRVLRAIPGVREVFSGEAIREGARYRYCWRVRFVHPRVIESYRDHPAHVEFANAHFRPMASDRITIDYRSVSDHPPVTVRQGSGGAKSAFTVGIK
jgi:fructose-bisphosphate aldolase class II